jgi:hypothetical protein
MILRNDKFYAHAKKSEIYGQESSCLGYFIHTDGLVSADSKSLKSITDDPQQQNFRKMQFLLGLLSLYIKLSRTIPVSRPLHDVIH